MLRPQASVASGEAPVTRETKIPVLIPAPQAPQKPHTPPGICFPRCSMAISRFSRSTSPPAFRYAVSRAAPTMVWCSGPCMWQNVCDMSFSMMSTGSFDVSFRQTETIASIPAEWHSSQT